MKLDIPVEEKILTALFLCSNESNEILAALRSEWNEKTGLSLHEKLLIINYSLLIHEVFPWKEELTEGIDHEQFCESFFVQPDLFLRVRPGKMNTVLKKLRTADFRFQIVRENTVALLNATRVESFLELDKEVVIQDYNSQQTGYYVKSKIANLKSKIHLWDCCAGSGGKSIMAYDINPNIGLTVSDVRESILVNLRKRFAKAGVENYKSFVIDIAAPDFIPQTSDFNVIICDAPCTGSGTWSRTPEQLYFFNENEIERFSSLQRKIVSNVIPQLQTGGSLVYITCSVFRKENEEVVDFIKENFHLKLEQMEVLKGYDKKADTMFVAMLSLPK